MRYETINRQAKINILLQRYQSFEADHYNHGLNADLLKAQQAGGDDSEQTERAVKEARSSQRTIESALRHIRSTLEGLGVKDIQKAINPPEENEPANRQAKRAAARKKAPAKKATAGKRSSST